MFENWISYLIKVNLAIVVFYGFYHLFFQHDTFFKWKRVVLLSIFIVSFIYPVIYFTEVLNQNREMTRIFIENSLYYTLPEIIINQQVTIGQFLLSNLLGLIYVSVLLIFFGWTMIQLFSIGGKIYRGKRSNLFGKSICVGEGLKTPFSFFHWIVLDPKLHNDDELYEIVLHEEAHVRQCHSIDVLICELMCIVCWFNPFVWLMKKEIRMNLEYLADRKVLDFGCNTENYQLHLLRLSYHKAIAKLTNNFNVSPLKKRIQMMNKKQTSWFGLAKYALFVPLAASLLLVNNVQAVSKMNPPAEVEKVMEIQSPTPQKVSKPITRGGEQAYESVDKMPEYPGKDQALMNYLNANIQYPTLAAKKKIEGTVYLRFIVTQTGTVENVEVVRSLDPSCDKEAVRVIKEMPKWTPGKQDGKDVAVFYTIPIRFKLGGTSKRGATATPN